MYPEKLEQMGIDYVRPTKEQQEQINTIIFDELVRGEQKPESLFYFEQVIESLKLQGCDAVVLGCTELPLLVNENESPLPALDSTRTLARAALRHALAANELKSKESNGESSQAGLSCCGGVGVCVRLGADGIAASPSRAFSIYTNSSS